MCILLLHMCYHSCLLQFCNCCFHRVIYRSFSFWRSFHKLLNIYFVAVSACTLRLFLGNSFLDSTFFKELSVMRVVCDINKELISTLSRRHNLQWLWEDLYLCKWNQNCITEAQIIFLVFCITYSHGSGSTVLTELSKLSCFFLLFFPPFFLFK